MKYKKLKFYLFVAQKLINIGKFCNKLSGMISAHVSNELQK